MILKFSKIYNLNDICSKTFNETVSLNITFNTTISNFLRYLIFKLYFENLNIYLTNRLNEFFIVFKYFKFCVDCQYNRIKNEINVLLLIIFFRV